MAKIVKVQDGNIVFSASDPAYSVDFGIKGQLNVTERVNVGDILLSESNISSTDDIGININATGTGNISFNTDLTGGILLNNVLWPSGTPTVGQFIGATSLGNIGYVPFLKGTAVSDTLTETQLNIDYPGTLPGQFVAGPATVYQCVNTDQWRTLGSGGGGGGATALNDLSDVTIFEPTIGQILTYNFMTTNWENSNPPGLKQVFDFVYNATELMDGTQFNNWSSGTAWMAFGGPVDTSGNQIDFYEDGVYEIVIHSSATSASGDFNWPDGLSSYKVDFAGSSVDTVTDTGVYTRFSSSTPPNTNADLNSGFPGSNESHWSDRVYAQAMSGQALILNMYVYCPGATTRLYQGNVQLSVQKVGDYIPS